MEERFHSLTQKVFKKDPAGLTHEETQELAGQYPYFAPIHFIRLLQLKEDPKSYHQQFQKSILYYPDPLSFEQFVEAQDITGWAEQAESQVQGEAFPDQADVPFETVAQEAEAPVETAVTEEEAPMASDSQADADIATPVTIPENGAEILNTERDLETADVESQVIPTAAVADREPTVPEPLPAAAENGVTELTFEPYHTVDYFASQGIRITAESISGDKFGKQVKSFTDWLKTMKRLPLAELGRNVTPGSEKKVENMAEHSVADADVVTESMAQVWEKQGNISKATEVYHKLSLQNPSKRAYFAAKIDKLTEDN